MRESALCLWVVLLIITPPFKNIFYWLDSCWMFAAASPATLQMCSGRTEEGSEEHVVKTFNSHVLCFQQWKGVGKEYFLSVFLKFPPYKKTSRFIFVGFCSFCFSFAYTLLPKPPLVSDFLNASIFPCICCLLPENRQALFLRGWGVGVVDYNIALTLVKLIW